MRSLVLFAAIALPIAGVALAYGCSDEPQVESLCTWVSDPGNCYRAFREDVVDAGTDCKPAGKPTPIIPGQSLGTTNGAFLTRDKLDTCIINEGGSVTIDPPIDLTMWPPDPFAQPTQYKITFKDDRGSECGKATYTSPHGFSYTIDAPPDAGASLIQGDGGTDVDASADVDAGDAGVKYAYGTFTEVNQPGRDTVDTTCPSGEAHHFVLEEVTSETPGLDGGAVSACPAFKDIVPQALFYVETGGINQSGGVSFSIVYPPINQPLPSNAEPQTAPHVNPDIVTYFNCSVPAAPITCQNGVQDGSETDVDCGGPITDVGDKCPARCVMGQLCLCDLDCDTGTCAVDTMTGMRTCQVGGTGRSCPYTIDPSLLGTGGGGGGGGTSSSSSSSASSGGGGAGGSGGGI